MKNSTNIKEIIKILRKENKFIILYFIISLAVFFSLKMNIPPLLKIYYQLDIYPGITDTTIKELIFDIKKNSNNIENEISEKLNKDSTIKIKDYKSQSKASITVNLMYANRSELKNNETNERVVYQIIDSNINKILKKLFLIKKNQISAVERSPTSNEFKKNVENELEREIYLIHQYFNILDKINYNKFVKDIVDNEMEREIYLIDRNYDIVDKINYRLLLSLFFASVFISFLHIFFIILRNSK